MNLTFISKTKFQNNEVQSSLKIIAPYLTIHIQNITITSNLDFWKEIQNKILGIEKPCDWLKELLVSSYVSISDNNITSSEQLFDSNKHEDSIIRKFYENFIGLILLTSSFKNFKDICISHNKFINDSLYGSSLVSKGKVRFIIYIPSYSFQNILKKQFQESKDNNLPYYLFRIFDYFGQEVFECIYFFKEYTTSLKTKDSEIRTKLIEMKNSCNKKILVPIT